MSRKRSLPFRSNNPYQANGIATIEVKTIGRETPDDIRHTLKHLCQAHFEAVQLYIDLSQPGAPQLVSHCEDLGFFLAGILPGLNDALTMILQYLNIVPIDYDQIQLHSSLAQEILTYIKGLDPNKL